MLSLLSLLRSPLRAASHSVRSRRTPLTLSGAVVVALALGGAALAAVVTGDEFRYSTVQTGYYNLSPAAFAPQGNFVADSYSNDAQGRQLQLAGAPPSPACFLAGLNLPQGGRFKKLDVWYASNTGNNISVRIYRTAMADGANELLTQSNSTDNTQTRQLMSKTFANVPENIIDNQRYTYSVTVCLTNTSDRYFAGRIGYTYKNAGD